jgi:hypothetical protein
VYEKPSFTAADFDAQLKNILTSFLILIMTLHFYFIEFFFKEVEILFNIMKDSR